MNEPRVDADRDMTPALQRLLYLEDDDILRDIVALILRTMGPWTVGAYGSPHEALQAAPALQPQMLVCDLDLPEMNGKEVWEALRTLPGLETLPVVLMTGYSSGAALDDFRPHALAVIHKPFDSLMLTRRLRAAWEEHCASLLSCLPARARDRERGS